jgi:hypothetical protein
MPYKKPDADERFRRLIDDFNFADQIVKHFEKERELVKKKIRNIVRRRGRGVHNGHESSISAFDVVRSIIDQEKVRAYTGKDFPRMFKKSKFIAVEGGPLKHGAELVPDLGPPHEVVDDAWNQSDGQGE